MTQYAAVRARVDAACAAAGRDPRDVTLVAVAKTHPASAIRAAVADGAIDIGENYAQELSEKRTELAAELPQIRWHFIGRLQRNKVKLVAGCALIHAVESVSLAEEIAKRAPGTPCLLAVNVAGEATKGGVAIADAVAIARGIAAAVPLHGLMTMPPPDVDPAPHFAAVVELRARLRDALALPLPALSMGMSDDFEIAIAAGATHVRIGTAIFGARGATAQ